MFNLILSILLFLFVPANQLETNIKNYLGEKLNKYSNWNYTVLTKLDKLTRENSTIEIDKEKDFKIKGEYGYIPVKIHENNQASSTFITVKLNIYSNVLCAIQRVSVGEKLNPDDFILVEKDITKLKGEPVESLEEINGCTAKLNIGKEAILLKSMVRNSNVIKVGDEVTAVYNNGSIDITFPAKARTEGSIGDKIQIISKDNKTFRAEVVDTGCVVITEY